MLEFEDTGELKIRVSLEREREEEKYCVYKPFREREFFF